LRIINDEVKANQQRSHWSAVRSVGKPFRPMHSKISMGASFPTVLTDSHRLITGAVYFIYFIY